METGLGKLLGIGSHQVDSSMPSGDMQANKSMGNISQIMSTMPASGLKKTNATVVALAQKLLDQVLEAYGPGKEADLLISAISKLSKITKEVQTGEMDSVIKSIVQLLPANSTPLQPGSASELLTAMKGAQQPQAQPQQSTPGPTMVQNGGIPK